MGKNTKIIIVVVIMITLTITAIGCNKKINIEQTGFFDSQYNIETDDQLYSDYFTMAVVEGGYYILNNSFLYFFDKESKEMVYVCSLLDCSHNSVDCDAYMNYAVNIWYYDNSIYYVDGEEDNSSGTIDYVLYKSAMDGSNRERIKKVVSTSSFVPVMTIHRGYLYYSVYGTDYSSNLYRIPIDGRGKNEKIYSLYGSYASIYKLKGYGDGVIFTTDVAEDDDTYKYNIMYYDSNSETVSTIMEDCGAEYTVKDGCIYDVRTDGVHCYNVESGTDEVFYDPGVMVYISFDGNNFYMDNIYDIFIENTPEDEHKVWVVNTEGELIDTIEIENSYICLFGDSDYLFQDYGSSIKMLDKSLIGTEEHEWSDLPLSKYGLAE